MKTETEQNFDSRDDMDVGVDAYDNILSAYQALDDNEYVDPNPELARKLLNEVLEANEAE